MRFAPVNDVGGEIAAHQPQSMLLREIDPDKAATLAALKPGEYFKNFGFVAGRLMGVVHDFELNDTVAYFDFVMEPMETWSTAITQRYRVIDLQIQCVRVGAHSISCRTYFKAHPHHERERP